jgi:hypothetical protein
MGCKFPRGPLPSYHRHDASFFDLELSVGIGVGIRIIGASGKDFKCPPRNMIIDDDDYDDDGGAG